MHIKNLIILSISLLLFSGCASQNTNTRQLGIGSQSFEVFSMGDVVYVKDSISDTALDSFDKACEAIQFAIESLPQAGGEIVIKSGKYELNSPIRLKSNVTLRGSGSATVLWMSDRFDGSIAIIGKKLDKVTVCDLSIKTAKENINAKTGILLSDCGDCKIKDVYCLGLAEHGIWLNDRSFLCEIRGCTFAGIGQSAIYLEKLTGNGRGGDFVPNLVTNCIIYEGGVGIECNYTIVLNIVGCQVYQSKSHGFYIHTNSNSVMVSGCRTFQIQDDAVVVADSDEINITGNIFCWHDGHGIVLNNVTWGTITGNNVIDTGHINIVDEKARQNWSYSLETPKDLDFSKRSRNGIHISGKSRGLTVGNNAVFNWGSNLPLKYGIYEESTCMNNVITDNNINYCLNEGVLSQGKNSISKDNFTEADTAYKGGDSSRMHRYDVRRIQKFIENNR